MAAKSERITILATPDFKAFLNAEAQAQGLSVSELVRERCAVPANSEEDAALLASIIDQVNLSTSAADKALSRGLNDLTLALSEIRKGK